MISIRSPYNLIIHYLFSFCKKKEAREVIYSAEVSVPSSGRDIIEVLKHVRQELKSNQYIDSALSLLSKGKPRSIAYKNILPSSILTLLKTGEAKQVMAGDLFKDYLPMQHIIQKAEGIMKSALLEPTIMYAMVSLLSYFTVNTFYINFSKMPHMDMSAIGIIRSYYFLLVSAPIVTVHFLIAKFPDRIPLWNRVYRYIRAANYLLIIKTLNDNGMSSADAIAFFKKLDDKHLLKGIKELKPHEKNIEGLAKALAYYLTPVESALLKTSVKFGEQPRILSGIVERRVMDVEKVVSGITGTFNKLLTTFAIVPVGISVYVLLSIVAQLTQRV